MVQKHETPRGAKSEPLTAEDVRTAVLHLEELAAAFEGEGMSMDGVDDDGDRATLKAVTEMLLKHRAKQRRLQRDAIHDAFGGQVVQR